MRFNTHNGVAYIPSNTNIELVEVLGDNITAIRAYNFLLVVNHPINEVIEIIRQAHTTYHTTGVL